jgi:hypothetical protein
VFSSIDYIKKLADLNGQPGLLEHLSRGGFTRVLRSFDKSSRERPRALKRHHHPLNKQDLALLFDQYACGYFWILKVNPSTSWTNSSRPTEARLDLDC